MHYKRSSGGLQRSLTATAIILLTASSCLAVRAESFIQCLDRADKLKQSGDDEGAIAAYLVAKGMAGKPVNDASVGLARLYHKLARYSEAEAEYSSMISASGSLDLKLELGQLYVDEGKFKEGAIIFQEMVARNPKHAGWLYALGVCCEGSEDMHTAKDHYERVIELAPDSNEAAMASKRLAAVKQTTVSQQKEEAFPIDPELGPIGLGWWNLKKMPIRVYIDQGHSTNFRPSMRDHVLRALQAWQHATNGALSFVIEPTDLQGEQGFLDAMKDTSPMEAVVSGKALPEDPIKTGIHVHWTDDLDGALGLAWTNVYTEHRSDKAERSHEITAGHCWLHTNSTASGRPLPDRETSANSSLFEAQDRLLARVTIHELGHCLGLTHSTNQRDVMCAGGYVLSTNSSEGLSSGDLASVRQHYDNFEGTGMPTKVTRIGRNGEVTVYRDSLKQSSARVQNISPVKLTTGGTATGSSQIKEVSSTSTAQAQANSAKFGDVLFDIQSKNYQAGLQKLTAILAKEPNNAMALYLRAVSEVMLHKYPEATTDYNAVIKLTPGSELANRASDGLKKLKH